MTNKKHTLRKPKTTQVRLSDICTDTGTFQFREEDLNEAHAEELWELERCAWHWLTFRSGYATQYHLWRPETGAGSQARLHGIQ